MTSMSPPTAEPQPSRGLAQKWKVLISVVFGIFMIILDTTVVNVAFQTIRSEFGASLNDSQWIISIYVLALGITTPLSGFLADRFGIKRMYVIGLAIFVFGSLLCGISTSLPMLIVARAIQGFGGGLAQPLGPAMLYRTFPPKEQGQALGMFGIALVLAPALGPLLGGLLVDNNLWRWIFFINLPIGIAGVLVASNWLPKDQPGRNPTLDPLGLVLAVVSFGSLLYASTHAAEMGWTSSSVVTWFVVGLVGLVLFAMVELFVAKEPLLDLRLFKNRNFLVSSLIGYVSVLALFGAEFLMPVYLQALRGRTALETGVILLALAVTSGLATPIAGRFYDRVGPRILVMIGFGLLIINTWQLSLIQTDTPIWWITVLLGIRGLALGLTIQTTFATSLASVPLPQLARGSSLLNSTRFVVQSVGVAILATVLSSSLSPEVRAQGGQARETTPGGAPFGLCETPGVPAADNIPPAAAAQLANLPAAQAEAAKIQIRAGIQQACQENLQGFENAYHLTFYFAILALVIALFLPGWPAQWAGRAGLQGANAPPSPSH